LLARRRRVDDSDSIVIAPWVAHFRTQVVPGYTNFSQKYPAR
jgi:hypothetical protein